MGLSFSSGNVIKVAGGQGLGCMEGGTTIATMELISSIVDEAVREGTLSSKRMTFFWASNFFSFSLSFFFQNYF